MVSLSSYRARRQQRAADERGYTLTELSIVLLLMALLFATVAPLLVTLTNVTFDVNDTYANENQLLPVSTNLQRLIRSAVSPGPTLASGQPIPAFGVYHPTNMAGNANTTAPYTALSGTSMTFFSNIGDPNGPALVVAQLNTGAETLTVSITRADPNTCPGINASPVGNGCTWGSTPATATRTLFVVQHVVNTTVFSYNLDSGTTPDFTKCTDTTAPNPATNCDAAQILNVGVDVQVNTAVNRSSQAEDITVVYQLSGYSQAYDPAVG